MESYKSGLSDAKKSLEDAQKKIREVESLLVAKDKIINDLRNIYTKTFLLYLKGIGILRLARQYFYA